MKTLDKIVYLLAAIILTFIITENYMLTQMHISQADRGGYTVEILGGQFHID